MRTLSTTCRNCGTAMQIEIEESGYFSDQVLVEMATCDRCFDALERIEKIRNQKANLGEDRKPTRQYRKPYSD